MSGDNTKQRILDVALNLFSQSGYAAVSIRDICKFVNIKESSVYYYFKSKRAIFDELAQEFQAKAESMMRLLESSMDSMQISGDNIFEAVSHAFFKEYLMDDFCNKFIRLMLIEQLSSEDVRRLYEKWMFDEPLQFQSKIFALLIGAGAVKKADSGYLAVKYYSPILLYTQQYLLCGLLTDEKKRRFLTQVDRHIQNFFMECGVF